MTEKDLMIQDLQEENRKLKVNIADWLKELKQYQSIGTLEGVREAVEKQKSKKPIFNEIRHRHRGLMIGECTTLEAAYNCPSCNLTLWKTDFPEYCPNCGQHIDWSEEDEKRDAK